GCDQHFHNRPQWNLQMNWLPVTKDRGQPAAASRIRFVIAAGCDTIDRWLESSSIVFAPIRAARNRSRSGEVVLSFFDTAYQVGLCLHAATLVFDVNSESEMRPCAA